MVSVLAVFVVVLLALTNASRPTAREGSAPPTRPPTAAPAGETAPPTPPETVAPAEPTPTPAEYVRVANTGQQGIILRRDPNTAAPRVVARAENTTLRVVGPDQVVEGRVWRQVEDSQGNRGWAPAEFLAPSAPPGG